ncbi:MAG: FHA domain-containing protein [Polyangiales bacterium]
MLKLVIADDEGQTTVVPLLRDEITIGRKAGNTIRLTERNVSRSHARLVKRNGAYIVEDLGSYNGVILNGERVDRSAEVASGDQIAIGDYELALRAETVPAPQHAPVVNSGPPPRLVVLTDPVAGAEFSLSKTTMRVGRDERLDIWINHKSISHEHAEIQIDDGVVTVFDLDSANGIRVNGIDTKRAILQSGDLLELGEVGFRLLVPQGTRSLEEQPPETLVVRTPPNERKPLFALAVIVALVATGAGAVFVTMQSQEPPDASLPPAVAKAGQTRANVAVESPAAPEPLPSTEETVAEESPSANVEPPQEWEGLLAESQAKLAKGRIDDAYRTADRLPADSVLRRSPEFGEIRYRYVQSKIERAQQLLEEEDAAAAKRLARQVLGIAGITSKQRRDAKEVVAQARKPKGRITSPEDALAEAHRCVGTGDNPCVIRALEAGQARSPAALALLIETYRALDDMSAARRHMRAFVQRYPENPRTARYEQMLGID